MQNTNNYLKLSIHEKFILEYIRNDSVQDFRYNALHKFPQIKFSFSKLPLNLRPFIFHESLNYSDLFILDEDSRKLFYDDYVRNIARNEYIRQLAKEISRVFTENMINSILLKGAALIFTLYKNEPIRTMSDIDILVDKNNLSKASDLLIGLGYKRHDKEKKQYFHYAFIRNNFVVELHWDIERKSNRLVLKKIFESSTKIVDQGIELGIPSNEVSFFLACVNFNRSFCEPFIGLEKDTSVIIYRTLFFLYEIKRIVESAKSNFNWREFIFLTKLARNKLKVFTLILLAEKIVKINTPKDILILMRRDPVTRFYMFSVRNLRYLDCNKLFLLREILTRFIDVPFLFTKPYSFISNLYQILLVFLYLYSYKIYLMIRKIRTYIARKVLSCDF